MLLLLIWAFDWMIKIGNCLDSSTKISRKLHLFQGPTNNTSTGASTLEWGHQLVTPVTAVYQQVLQAKQEQSLTRARYNNYILLFCLSEYIRKHLCPWNSRTLPSIVWCQLRLCTSKVEFVRGWVMSRTLKCDSYLCVCFPWYRKAIVKALCDTSDFE